MSKMYQHFEYLSPQTLKEALSLYIKYKDETKLIAGGTDLLVSMKNRDLAPAYLISLKDIPNLDFIQYEENGLKIGALTRISEIEKSATVKEKFPILHDAASQFGSTQIRNMATVIGNLCSSVPSADMAPPLMALDAKVKLVSLSGERVVMLEDFFSGPGENVLQSNEILTEIQIPNPGPYTLGTYLKMMARAAVSIALAGVAVLITMNAGRTRIVDAKIVLGAVSPVPIRATEAEQILKGKLVDDKLIEEASQAAGEASSPVSDIRCSALYREQAVRVLVKRAIRKLLSL